MEIAEIECMVSGKVQRVMYRDFVQRKARPLGVKGYVENLEDGSVRVVAQGTEESLEQLIEYLHRGSFAARVMRVDTNWREVEERFADFKIIY